jgi:hypothetical protein
VGNLAHELEEPFGIPKHPAPGCSEGRAAQLLTDRGLGPGILMIISPLMIIGDPLLRRLPRRFRTCTLRPKSACPHTAFPEGASAGSRRVFTEPEASAREGPSLTLRAL